MGGGSPPEKGGARLAPTLTHCCQTCIARLDAAGMWFQGGKEVLCSTGCTCQNMGAYTIPVAFILSTSSDMLTEWNDATHRAYSPDILWGVRSNAKPSHLLLVCLIHTL